MNYELIRYKLQKDLFVELTLNTLNYCFLMKAIGAELATFAAEMKEQLLRYDQSKAEALAAEVERRRQKSRYFVVAELASFVLALGFVALSTLMTGGGWWLGGAAMWLVIYAVVRRQDVRCGERITELQHLQRVYEKEAAYQRGDFSPFDSGDRYQDSRHPFTFDLDIFGRDSLFQRICRAVTTGGADRLAGALSQVGSYHDHREALRELAGQEAWRARLMSMGQERVIDTTEIVETIRRVSQMRLPRWYVSPAALAVACIALCGFYASILLAVMGVVGAGVPIAWGMAQLFMVVGLVSRALKGVTKATSRLSRELQTVVAVVRHVAQADWHSPELCALQQQLDTEATASFNMLDGMVRSIDQRSNEMGVVVFNVFCLADFFIVRRFLRWQGQYVARMEEWIDCVAQIDMLVSMATFRHNEPEATEARVDTSVTSIIYKARGIYHPFLVAGQGRKAVGNDFEVVDRHFYIITGANMAGKSTFLRSVGINYLLAMNGMPVFADELEVSCFQLFTSMRTSDDLSRGISFFNAELLRLRQLIETTQSSAQPTLIILDEILKGTNSLDKLNGSRFFLENISRQNVSGIIATHDLELSRMEGERFHNYCFEIELGTDVTYSYRLTHGVARNQNATFLLKQIIDGRG